ncbi:MAG: DUF448 domain-containing protein [Leptolyngbya foveolarum]|uniref:DUF448 domain-containing protein n=1 Tax=Leptolyngbya foveolarum TaxID=47253 RepID=A0A2W4UI95_9CYAN|nr:MAG: DUF448 domain-containing protein [Leptolyngbya foveolarum]
MAQKNHRLCISCRQTAHRDTLWRIVRTFPSRHVSLNDGMGRSAYLCRNPQCLENAQKKNRLGKALRSPVPPEIYKELHNLLIQRSSEQTDLSSISSK